MAGPLLAAVFGLALAGCETTEELRQANLDQDQGACADMGASYGSRDHTRCMLDQQARRDREGLDNQQRALMSAEQARINVETQARVRCEREARQDRENGRRPRRCS